MGVDEFEFLQVGLVNGGSARDQYFDPQLFPLLPFQVVELFGCLKQISQDLLL